ncbi:alpha/beta hydrolase [Algimonas arctica]|nr:alpha/beta hydrolase [Algimonas arctica]
MKTEHTEPSGGLLPDGMDAASSDLIDKVNAILLSLVPGSESPIELSRGLASDIFMGFAGPDFYPYIETEDVKIPGAEDYLSARVYYHPKSAVRLSPLVLFLHGGGWSLAGLDEYDGLIKALAAQSGANFISLDYRLAPENPFPAALNDSQAALNYILENAADFRGLANKVAVMGDSAGGNLATVLAQSPENSGTIQAQFLLYPMLDVFSPHATYPSRVLYGDGDYFLTRDALDVSVENYGLTKELCKDPRVSPLFHTAMADLPPTYIIVGNCDPLRDEARTYAERLTKADVDVTLDCIPGAIHAFLSFGILDDVKTHRTRLAREIQRRLGSE